jgi:predicted MFS family arabinose efflux permease
MVGQSWTYLPAYIVLAAIGGIAAAFYRAAEAGALRVIVPAEQYPQAMSVIEGRQATASVAGGPIGGALLAAGNSVPFWVNAGSFLLSLLGLTRTRAELGSPSVEPGYRVLSAVKDGLRYIWTRRVFRRLTLAASLSNFSVAAFNFTLIVMLQRRGEPYWVIGLIQTMIGASLLVGSVLAPRLTRRFSVGALVVGSALLETAMLCVAVLLNAFIVPLMIVTSLCYLLAPASNAAWFSYLALATPHEYQGRLASAEDFFSTALLPLGTVAAGLLIAGSSTTPALMVLAACFALSTAYLVSSEAIRSLPRLGSAEAA